MAIHVASSRPLAAARTASPAGFTQERVEDFVQNLRDEQRFGTGAVAGLAAALIGAFIWGAITAITHYQIGWMAVGVGFLVGYAVRLFGKGVEPRFGYLGAGLALFGCLAGNILAVCLFFSYNFGVPLFDILGQLTPSACYELLKTTFSPVDLLFYALAVYEGYRISFRCLTPDEVSKLTV